MVLLKTLLIPHTLVCGLLIVLLVSIVLLLYVLKYGWASLISNM